MRTLITVERGSFHNTDAAWQFGHWLMTGRCADGCHEGRVVLADTLSEDAWAEAREALRNATARAHPEAT